MKDSSFFFFFFSSRRRFRGLHAPPHGFFEEARPVTSVNATSLGRDENPSNRLIFVLQCQQTSGIPLQTKTFCPDSPGTRRRSFSIRPWMEPIPSHPSRLRGFVTFPGVPFRPWAYGYHTPTHTHTTANASHRSGRLAVRSPACLSRKGNWL